MVIVNWNGKHLLDDCLGSLLGQSFSGFEVIVVDNGSRDGSVEYIRSRYPSVALVTLPGNSGFAGGSNAGIRAARGNYIALLNNDTRVDPEWLNQLVTSAEANAAAGMWASKILTFNDPQVIDNVGLLLYRDGLGRGKGRLRGTGDSTINRGKHCFRAGAQVCIEGRCSMRSACSMKISLHMPMTSTWD